MTDVDLSEFEALNSEAGGKCATGSLIREMPAGEQVKVQAAMDDPMIQTMAIYRWLKTHGYDISDKAVGRHRRGECRCER